MSFLTVAERAYAEPPERRGDLAGRIETRPATWPDMALIFDTETTTKAAQSLTFGSYAVARLEGDHYELWERGLFHADNLQETDPSGYGQLKAYARQHGRELLSQQTFTRQKLLKIGYEGRKLVVGFNLPFDLSRVARGQSAARHQYAGGFSLISDADKRGQNRYAPRIRIKSQDSKRAFIGFSKPHNVHPSQLVPDGATNARKDPRYVYPGRFLDLRSLAFALTDRSHSLDSACKAFGVSNGKGHAEEHGVITAEYIAYNEQDVTASLNLLNTLKAEFDVHPIDLLPDKALSPASIAKAYLGGLGVKPPVEKNPGFPAERIGQAMSAYYGGRAECRIRKTPVPIVYTDFLSMYPTVNSLLGTWEYITAEHLIAVDATEELQDLLDDLTLVEVFMRGAWKQLAWFGEIEPDGDIVPVRATYDDSANGYQIGVNPFTSTQSSLYAGPDLVAAKLLTGRTPKLRRAWKLVPQGRQAGLSSLQLRGQIPIDPSQHDFFRRVIETRKSLDTLPGLTSEERDRLNLFLKVVANSGSYGIFAEINPDTHAKPKEQHIHSGVGSWTAKVGIEKPGRYSFPPLAALITAGARLMLAALECAVAEYGGTYAMCDTDSMAIVSTQDGGLVPCDGGPHTLRDGTPAIRALSWNEVDKIVKRFARLNPYDQSAIPGSVLEIEKENYAEGGDQEQLYAYVISAKRYALYNLTPDGRPVLRKWSEHGLGHLLNPTDPDNPDNPDNPDRDWIRQTWQRIIGRAHSQSVMDPEWLDRPALTRRTITKPSVAKAFTKLNGDKPYQEQIKPFNFILSAHVAPLGHPAGVDPLHFQLVAPYESDPSKWQRLPWTDVHTGRQYRITTDGQATATTARVQTYRDVLDAYAYHPESKSAGAVSGQATHATVGLLRRLHVNELQRVHIGKESNRLEDVEAGDAHDLDEVLLNYGGPKTDAFNLYAIPRMKQHTARALADTAGITPEYVKGIRNGRKRPSRNVRKALVLGLAPTGIRELEPLTYTEAMQGIAAEALESLGKQTRADDEPIRGHFVFVG